MVFNDTTVLAENCRREMRVSFTLKDNLLFLKEQVNHPTAMHVFILLATVFKDISLGTDCFFQSVSKDAKLCKVSMVIGLTGRGEHDSVVPVEPIVLDCALAMRDSKDVAQNGRLPETLRLDHLVAFPKPGFVRVFRVCVSQPDRTGCPFRGCLNVVGNTQNGLVCSRLAPSIPPMPMGKPAPSSSDILRPRRIAPQG